MDENQREMLNSSLQNGVDQHEYRKPRPADAERGLVFRGSMDDARFSEGEMRRVADDDVVADFDLKRLASFHQTVRRADVCIRLRWVAARVVVHEHHRVCCADDGCAKYLARMGDGFVQRTDAHDVMSSDALARIEQQHDETFDLRVEMRSRRNVCTPVSDGIIRAQAIGLVRCGFPHGDDFPFARTTRFPLLLRPRFPCEEIELHHSSNAIVSSAVSESGCAPSRSKRWILT